MKYFFVLILLAFLVFPCFSQSTSSERFQALSEAMGRTIEEGDATMENLNYDSAYSQNMKTYLSYRRKHETLSSAMNGSANRIDLYIRTNDKADKVTAERDNYENLLSELKTAKTDYDSWLRNVK